MQHFNWFELIIPYNYAHVGSFFLGCLIVIALCFLAKRSVALNSDLTPSPVFGVRALFELVTDFVSSLCVMVIGEKGRQFTPLFASLFFIILINNLLGLFPGMTPATENLNTTVVLGLFTFIAYNFYGFKEHKIAYLKQFIGPLLVLAPLMLIIELISHFVRPLSLGLRLYGNMMGDHTVIGIFLNLTPYVIPIIFYALGLFVCFMQAFIFTILSIIYLSMAISHDH